MSNVEEVSEMVHNLWWLWSTGIAATEDLSEDRKERWKTMWVSYNKLSEEDKDVDRELAKRYFRELITVE